MRELLAADVIRAEFPLNVTGVDPVGTVPFTAPAGVVLIVSTDRADRIHAHVDGDDLIIHVNDILQVHDADQVDIIAVCLVV